MVLPLIAAGLSWLVPQAVDWLGNVFNDDDEEYEEDYYDEEYEEEDGWSWW